MATASAGPINGSARTGPPLGLSWPLLVAALAFLCGLDSRLLNDPDTYWHLAAANWMFAHLQVPAADPFSHTMPGAPWVAHEWLSELLLGLAFRAAGWAGPVALAAAAFALALAMLCRYLLRHLESVQALSLTALAAFLLLGHLLARPHALVFPVIVAWSVVLVQAREAGRAPAWPWALLMGLWANLHGSFILGLGLAAFFTVEAAWEAAPAQRREMTWAWGRFAALAALAALLTPHGLRGFTLAANVGGMSYTLNYIDEWRSPDFHQFQPMELALLLGALAVLQRGLRLPLLRTLLLLALIHLALVARRYADVLAILAPLTLAEFVGRQWPRQTAPGAAGRIDAWFGALARPAHSLAIAGVMAVVLAATCLQIRSGALAPPDAITPAAAVRAAQAAGLEGAVLNSYGFGGYLIYMGVAPGIDGRADMYGDAFVAEYTRALELKTPERFLELLERYRIGWTLLLPGTPAAALLDYLPGWRRLYADETAVVHVRQK